MPPLILNGNSIYIRDMTAEDVPQYYEWFWESNPQSMTCRKVTRKPIEEVVEHMRGHFEKKDVLFFSVCSRDTDQFMGRITLFDYNEQNQAMEFGYMIGPPHRRCGIGREAVGLILKHCFETIRLNKLIAQTGAFNIASIKLLEHFGFHQDGRLRAHHLYNNILYDDLIYSLLSQEYFDRRDIVD